MTPSVVGLGLDTATKILEAAGLEIDAIESATPPEGTGRPHPQEIPTRLFVATQWTTRPGAVRLRVVSAPLVPV